MIGQLSGTILEKASPHILLDVHGVGYEIDAPLSTFHQLPEVGAFITLLTHLIIREDAHHLYGFSTREERTLFRTLLKVNGVGPKLALTILSHVSPQEFVRLVLSHDTAHLVAVPGIGNKTAERLVIEMRDKLADLHYLTALQEQPVPAKHSRHSILQDAISALISLGYKPQEANRMINQVDDGLLTSEDLIRAALRERTS